MATFPGIKYSERLPSGRGPSVPWDVDVSTGQEYIARGISAIGESLQGVANRIHEQESVAEYSELKRKVDEAGFAAYNSATGDMKYDPETGEFSGVDADLFDKYVEDIGKFQSEKPNVNSALRKHINEVVPNWRQSFYKHSLGIAKKNADAKADAEYEMLLSKRNLGEALVLLDERLATKSISQEKYNGLIKSMPNDSIREQMRVASVNNPQIVEGLFEQLIDPTPDQLVYANNIKVQAQTAISNQDDKIGGEFLGLLSNKLDPGQPQLTFDMITNSELSFDAKTEWFTRLRTFDNYSEGELKEAFTDKGEVLADIYNKIDEGTITDELDTMVGKGLSPNTSHRIKREIREPYKRDTDQMFKRLFGWKPDLGFTDNLAAFRYEKVLREWEAEIKKQDATGEEIIDIGRSIARPYFTKHLEKTMPSNTNISRMLDLALGEEIKEVKPIEAEKPEEKPKEAEAYETGEVREDKNGQLWEYIGDNKWRKK